MKRCAASAVAVGGRGRGAGSTCTAVRERKCDCDSRIDRPRQAGETDHTRLENSLDLPTTSNMRCERSARAERTACVVRAVGWRSRDRVAGQGEREVVDSATERQGLGRGCAISKDSPKCKGWDDGTWGGEADWEQARRCSLYRSPSKKRGSGEQEQAQKLVEKVPRPDGCADTAEKEWKQGQPRRGL